MSDLVPLRVAIETPQHAALAGVLDYLGAPGTPAGTLVRVPLGRRIVPGIVWPGASADIAGAGHALKAVAEVAASLPVLPPDWLALLDFAAGYYQRSVGELALACLPPALRQLDAAAIAKRVARHRKRPPAVPGGAEPERPAPTTEQAAALAAFAQADARPALLFGATGSGKTEVYLRAAEDVLDRGGQVLLLVPEINLTPQFEARVAERFPRRVLVSQHSGLSAAQRLQGWLAAHLGQADIVLGTRLAIFTPMPRLALIVVDEEHDPSFKQQDGARYSARDLAVWRGHQLGVPVLLGSATPALESWHRAALGRWRLLAMPQRIGGGAMPQVELIDMRRLPRPEGEQPPPALAPPLQQAIEATLARGEQALLLLNRRGYAPVLHCGACGWKSRCPHCSAWRVFHKSDRTLRCHHCAFGERVPRACPDCGNLDIAPIGRGTERLEEQIASMLPGARVARIDADTTRRQGSLQTQLAAVHAGEVDVLVGTQMLTKGHDFRRITLVAAVNPDGALFAADFRAAERLFSLLLQAAGRAGRDAQAAARSRMWLQTWAPQHPVYAALQRYDYEAFARAQLAERRAAGLPPFMHLALLRAEARTREVALAFARAASAEGVSIAEADRVRIYPPVPPPVARVADVERVQMLIECASRPVLQRFLGAWLARLPALRGEHRGLIRWALDVDPLTI